MRWDRFDICEAWYLFAVRWHEGQWSKTYEIFGRLDRMGFSPRHMTSPGELTENGQEIYLQLVRRRLHVGTRGSSQTAGSRSVSA